MNAKRMLKPYDDVGKEINSLFQIERRADGFDLIVESQGGPTGGRPPRNTGYAQAVKLHLERMKTLDMVLADLQIASAPVMKYLESDRRIEPEGFRLPLALVGIANLEELRLAIGRASAAFENPKSTGGNRTKKLRFRMKWQAATEMTVAQISDMLASPTLIEAPTSDKAELQKRVSRAQGRLRTARTKEHPAPPLGQRTVPKTSTSVSRYVRDPEVIAWVLDQASGKCENCGNPAPFTRANGDAFLEVHHVRPLGEGGPDTVDNAAACCPNCHRRLHFDPESESLSRTLIASIRRLIHYPLVS